MKLALVGVALLWLWPQQSYASVLISEVAWMGTEVSANDEWIELYNNGKTEILLDGWVLTDGDKLEIKLVGAIGAGQYVVLERTNDDSAPGPAFLVYSGALKNIGTNLLLKNAEGAIVEELIGGENWREIGGNNITKETAQYTDQGWLTGKATPGEVNIAVTETSMTNSSDEPFVFANYDNELTPDVSVVTSMYNSQLAEVGSTSVPNVLWPYWALLVLLAFSTVTVYVTKID